MYINPSKPLGNYSTCTTDCLIDPKWGVIPFLGPCLSPLLLSSPDLCRLVCVRLQTWDRQTLAILRHCPTSGLCLSLSLLGCPESYSSWAKQQNSYIFTWVITAESDLLCIQNQLLNTLIVSRIVLYGSAKVRASSYLPFPSSALFSF